MAAKITSLAPRGPSTSPTDHLRNGDRGRTLQCRRPAFTHCSSAGPFPSPSPDNLSSLYAFSPGSWDIQPRLLIVTFSRVFYYRRSLGSFSAIFGRFIFLFSHPGPLLALQELYPSNAASYIASLPCIWPRPFKRPTYRLRFPRDSVFFSFSS